MLRKLTDIKKRNEGFTIIEVLIVLAIAALILVVVLIAIPQLQRNQRNTSRRDATSRVASAVNEFQSNNNGKLPANTTDLDTIRTSVGTIGQYNLTASSTTALGAAGVSDTLVLVTAPSPAGIAALAPGAQDKNLSSIQIVKNGHCGTSGAVDYDSNSRRMAIQYLIESGGSPSPVCLDVQ